MLNVKSRPHQREQYPFRELGDQNIEFAAMTLISVGPIGEYPLMNKGLFAVAPRYAVKNAKITPAQPLHKPPGEAGLRPEEVYEDRVHTLSHGSFA